MEICVVSENVVVVVIGVGSGVNFEGCEEVPVAVDVDTSRNSCEGSARANSE